MKQNINCSNFRLLGCLFIAGGLFFSSCIKNYTPNETNFSGLKPTVLIPEGGLATFSAEALTFSPVDSIDSASFHLNYAATNVAPQDETITIAIDPTALASFNSSSAVQYEIFPDSIFTFTTTTVTIKKGNNYSDAISLVVFPSKVDPTHNYMLPISITGAPGGSTISGNYGTIYYHFIGNPLAGPYDVTGTRYNYTGAVAWSGPPAAVPAGVVATTDMSLYSPRIAAPDDPTTIEIPFGNVGAGYNYILTWDGTPGDPLAVEYTFSPENGGPYSGIVTYVLNFTPPDATHKASFHIVTHYSNAAAGAGGNDRIFDETFVHE